MGELVEAEVISENKELAVAWKAGSITYDFSHIEEIVNDIVAEYDGWIPNPENLDDVAICARERKYLNGIANQIDSRRKEIKAAYVAPLSEFESKANAIRDKIKECSSRLKEVEDTADGFRRGEVKQKLEQHYEDYAGLLVPVVPYERLHDERWTNKTCKLKDAFKELENKVDKIADDWDAIKQIDNSIRDEAEVIFFQTLDASHAIRSAREKHEASNKIAELKREMSGGDDARPCVCVIDSATTEQMREIGKFAGSIGVHGVFISGTLQEAARKERQNGGK